MNRKDFSALLEQSFSKIRALNRTKGSEYSGDEDALANFKENAKELGLTPFDVWAVYAGKHWDSIRTFVKDQRQGQERNYSESIEGRALDLALYALLFLALVKEREEGKAPADQDFLQQLIWEDH